MMELPQSIRSRIVLLAWQLFQTVVVIEMVVEAYFKQGVIAESMSGTVSEINPAVRLPQICNSNHVGRG